MKSRAKIWLKIFKKEGKSLKAEILIEIMKNSEEYKFHHIYRGT